MPTCGTQGEYVSGQYAHSPGSYVTCLYNLPSGSVCQLNGHSLHRFSYLYGADICLSEQHNCLYWKHGPHSQNLVVLSTPTSTQSYTLPVQSVVTQQGCLLGYKWVNTWAFFGGTGVSPRRFTMRYSKLPGYISCGT